MAASDQGKAPARKPASSQRPRSAGAKGPRAAAAKGPRAAAAKGPPAAAAKGPRSAGSPKPRPKADRLRQPAQPGGTPTTPRTRKPVPATGADIIGTAVQAAAELAEIGMTVSARAIRRAVARLPRP
jgi:hypothetical protein